MELEKVTIVEQGDLRNNSRVIELEKVLIIVCKGCGDLNHYTNCTYEQAMDYICFDRAKGLYDEQVTVKDSRKPDCYRCDEDS